MTLKTCASTILLNASPNGASEAVMPYLHTFIVIGSNAYDEYTFVSWLNRTVYRRTVDLKHVCLQ